MVWFECSAALSVLKSGKQWSLGPGMLQSLRLDQVPLDQLLAAHFITCFGQLGDVPAAEAILKVCSRPGILFSVYRTFVLLLIVVTHHKLIVVNYFCEYSCGWSADNLSSGCRR